MLTNTLLISCFLSSCENHPAGHPAQPSLERLRDQWNTGNQQWSDEELRILYQGQQVYQSYCAVCHLDNGEGQAMMGAPALKGGCIVNGPVHFHRQLILAGRGDMSAFQDVLNQEEIAAVVSYERNAWGNNEGRIIPALNLENSDEDDTCELPPEGVKSMSP